MKKNDMKIEKLYSLEHTMAKELLEKRSEERRVGKECRL